MKIVNHKIVEGGTFLPSKNVNSSSGLVEPTAITIHYTASGGADGLGDVSWLSNPSAKASAHFVVGRDGGVNQIVETNRRAWHAGVSEWNGRRNCNNFMIGIEVDNWGFLTKRADGKFYSHKGQVVPADRVVQLTHKNTPNVQQYWEVYDYEQFQAVANLCIALVEAYPTITEIVGHDDIAPGRKIDPGPAFNMNNLKTAVFGRDNQSLRYAYVNAEVLNMRAGPGTNFDIIGKLPINTKVEVLYDDSTIWSKVKSPNGIVGWVSEHYLK